MRKHGLTWEDILLDTCSDSSTHTAATCNNYFNDDAVATYGCEAFIHVGLICVGRKQRSEGSFDMKQGPVREALGVELKLRAELHLY